MIAAERNKGLTSKEIEHERFIGRLIDGIGDGHTESSLRDALAKSSDPPTECGPVAVAAWSAYRTILEELLMRRFGSEIATWPR